MEGRLCQQLPPHHLHVLLKGESMNHSVLSRLAGCGLIIACFLFVPATAFSWTRIADFENGEIGTKAENAPDAFDDAAGFSTYTKERVFKGEQAARVQVKKDSEGWGTFGGVINFPEHVDEGKEVWVSISVYFPESYVFRKPPGDNKFIRIRTKGPRLGSRYAQLYLTDDRIRFIRTASNWKTLRNDGPPRGEWVTYEIYLRFGHVPSSENGFGRMRFWMDGDLVAEHNDVSTLGESDAYAYSLYVFTWWGNGGPPKDLHAYVDNIVITTEPRATDSYGNSYIGMRSPPSPPSIEIGKSQ